MKILLAEQFRNVSYSLSLILSKQGEVDVVYDGAQALERLTNGPYDLLITEIDIPRVSGETLVKLAASRGIKVKTIGILPFSEVTEKDLSDGYGMDALIPKPFAAGDLSDLVKDLSEENEEDERFSFVQRRLLRRLQSDSSLSVGQLRKTLPETFGSIYALVRSINSKLETTGEKRRIIFDDSGYKVVNV